MIHVGITGFNAAGKGEVADYLKRKGLLLVSLSDLLREEAQKRGLDPNRKNLTSLGQKLRSEMHPGFLAKAALDRIDLKKRHVIDSIRHPYEIKILKQHLKPFLLIGVDAPVAVRFERSKLRGRNENAKTMKKFIEREQAEMKNDLNAQQLHLCMDLCDYLIINDGSLQDMEAKVDEAITTYEPTR